jgi:hypothetical protein
VLVRKRPICLFDVVVSSDGRQKRIVV